MKLACHFALFFLTLTLTAGPQRTIDSLRKALDMHPSDSQRLRIYHSLLHEHTYQDQEQGLKYIQPAMVLAEKLNWPAGRYNAMTYAGKLCWKLGRFDEAIAWHRQALLEAEKQQKTDWKVNALTDLGQDYTDYGRYPEAIRYLEQALAIAKEIGDKGGQSFIYSILSYVCTMQGNQAEAARYTLAALRLAEESRDFYSAAILLGNLGDLYDETGADSLALAYRQKAYTLLVYLKIDSVNLGYEQLDIGQSLQKLNQRQQARTYYLRGLQTGRQVRDKLLISSAYKRLAAWHLDAGDEPTGLQNLLLALGVLGNLDAPSEKTALNIKIARSMLRLGRVNEATAYFSEAWQLIQRAESDALYHAYYDGLEKLDSTRGKWKDAYWHLKQAVRLNEKINSEEATRKVMQTSMQYEYDKEEAAAKAKQEKKDLRQRMIRNIIAGGLAGTIFFMVLLFRQRNKIARARRRSDELLLNILPEEVAGELKEKGQARARHYDQVTVMFTDFKHFTQIAEQMDPVELVAEIDFCFKAFDDIISKYPIEKIKTIGDSYMCAGGLPVTNQTHAADIVAAALDIRQFMLEEKARRELQGKPFFEVRIGCHTGPVVAGIVGNKKFAYDIWGDTVNIASRMESSGEPGEVNISGATYELVKEHFTCRYRGKIDAKNKGQVDMYFAG